MDGLPSKIGPYTIVRQLGEGGMGSVYEAVHEATARRVAIKVLLPEYARDPTMTARFFNEARSVNKIDHPGTLQIFDYGHQEDGCAYIAMELLKGETLSARLLRGPATRPIGEALRIGWQIASALAAAHAAGIVHRDLKPDNVMLVPDVDAPGGERAKLLDFGIAKLLESVRGDTPKTQSQVVMGTPQYMSPEQCRAARHVDEKTDVYALGTMLFELLAGRTPFIGESGGEYIGMHLFREPPRLGDLMPNLPAEVTNFINSLLVKDKTLRPTMPQTATMLAQLLRSHGAPSFGSEQIYAQASHAASPTIRMPAFSTLGRSIGQLGRGAFRSRLRIGVAVLLLIVPAIAAYTLRNRLISPPAAQSVAPPPVVPAELPPKAEPSPAPPVRWSIRSTPAGASVVDGDGKILGRTPWQQTTAASPGKSTLTLRLPGYADQKVVLDRSTSDDRQERLSALPPSSSPSPAKPKRPPDRPVAKEKAIPGSIEFEP